MTRYKPRPHAIDRALLRFGISSEQSETWFNQLMETARHIGKNDGGKRDTYDHKGKRIITEGNEIVTIFTVADLPFGGKISALVERELKRAKKEFDKRSKELSIKIAEITIEQAQYSLNFLKAKSPSVKRSIQTKLNGINEQLTELTIELQREDDAYKALKMQSRGYLTSGGEVG